jgi:hypothetical protein
MLIKKLLTFRRNLLPAHAVSKKFQNSLSKNLWCQISEIFLVMLKRFSHLLYKFLCLYLPPSSFLSFLSTTFRILFTCPSYLLRTLLPSVSFTFRLHPKHAVTGGQKKKSVMLRIELLNRLAFMYSGRFLVRTCELPYWAILCVKLVCCLDDFCADLRLKYV